MNPYETDPYLREYLFFHYGRPREFCPFPFAPRAALDFHRRIVEECLVPIRFPPPTRGLDVGCAVGRATFELARKVDWVVGIDQSRAFIRAGRHLARGRPLIIRVPDEGDRCSRWRIELPAVLRKSRVTFAVGDAQALGEVEGRPFHVVLAINLIDRLARPRWFLRQLPRLVIGGGQLVIASPYTWLTQYTPRRQWLTGPNGTGSVVEAILRPWFRLARRRDLPFLIREHRRKYQWCVAEVSTYVRV